MPFAQHPRNPARPSLFEIDLDCIPRMTEEFDSKYVVLPAFSTATRQVLKAQA
jgi:hypothetical protein